MKHVLNVFFLCMLYVNSAVAVSPQEVPGLYSEEVVEGCYLPKEFNPQHLKEDCGSRCQDYLKRRLGRGLKTRCFTVEPWPDEELIKGQIGCYYEVSLREINLEAAGFFNPLYFQCGRHEIDRADSKLKKTLSELSAFFSNFSEYKIYVRGGADVGGNCPIDQKHDGKRTIPYLQQVSESPDRYVGYRVKTIHESITNGDLPILRAEFIKKMIDAPVYFVKGSAEILESRVSGNTENPNDRQAQIFFYLRCGN